MSSDPKTKESRVETLSSNKLNVISENYTKNNLEFNSSIEATINPVQPLPTYDPLSELHVSPEFIEKLQALKFVLESDLVACDAKWTLFVSAALSYRYDSQLKPMPQKFFSEKNGCNIDALISIVNDTPKMKVILQNIIDQNNDEVDTDVINLLHWVLVETQHPILRSVGQEEFSTIILNLLVDQEKESNRPTHVFEVCYSQDSNAEVAFKNASIGMPTKMAFYGDKLDRFYSIIHKGFPPVNNIGQGDYELNLYPELSVVCDRTPNGAGWGASSCGSMISCVALCEYINDENYVKTKTDSDVQYIEVTKHEYVRPRYLLIFGSRFLDENSAKHVMLNWVSRHKYFLSLLCYAALLTSIGIANSGSGHYFKHLFNKKATHLLDVCRKIFVVET